MEFVKYGNSKIEFNVKRSARNTLGIAVLPCGVVEVSAPENASIEKIKNAIVKRGAWILEQKRLTEFNPISQPEKKFITGESFYLLGRHYRLKVFQSNYDSVSILDDRFILNCTFPSDFELKRSVFLNWLLEKSTGILNERFRDLTLKFKQETIQSSVKMLSKRWGEYHPSKNLVVLNAELVVAPIECIDYVIIHELTHAICLHHGPEFYDLLSNRLPRWRDLKNELEAHSNGFSAIISKSV